MAAKLEVDILTLFPGMCSPYLGESILGKARESGLLEARVTDIREHASGRHRVADDAPYGGGAGMVMKPEPLTTAIEAARGRLPGALVVLLGPRGKGSTRRWRAALPSTGASSWFVAGTKGWTSG